MLKIDLAYAAGIVDGEGCVSLTRCNRSDVASGYVNVLKVAVAMTTPSIPTWLHTTFGGSLTKKKASYNNHRDVYTWMVQSNQAQIFLEQLTPHLKLKAHQAKLGVQFQQLKSTGGYKRQHPKPKGAYEIEEEFVQEMHRLNQGGR